jgi:FkbM family methyltransferase
MAAKEHIKAVLKTVLRKTRIRPYHFGINLYDDIKLALPSQKIGMIFDVGANIGQTAQTLRTKYPLAIIHCFEPNPECCETMRALDLGLRVHQTAVGSKRALKGFDRSRGESDMFRLVDDLGNETVQVETIDDFCRENAIERIDLLKIDTEGHDLEVIRGAGDMLAGHRVDLVQAETSMNCSNSDHVSFFDVQTQMESLGYRLFGIYEQMYEWPTGEAHMRRANVAYISPRVIAANRRGGAG